MKKVKISFVGIIIFSLFSTFFAAFATNKPIDTMYPEEKPGTKSGYHCYWLPGSWNGPLARDCMGCVERPMENPQVSGTCKNHIE